ncbi:DHH family phosphoesterase [Aneurinibacillus aneurinilyticus]|uniref:DHH family phosphoesterase n=1 Tax=Aneurinibacillus aneurinilyticus TaxID=1391 RepID=UPI0035258AB6
MKSQVNASMQEFLARAERMGIKVQIRSDNLDTLFSEPGRHESRKSRPHAVKLFTHNDTDGVSCGILGKLAFGDDIQVDYSNYDDINDKVGKLLSLHLDKYDQVFITDISVNEEIAARIEGLGMHDKKKFLLLDHHQTADWLNRYEWARVTVESAGVKASGTTLFYDYLVQAGFLLPNDALSQYVELVRQYDTWDWKEHGNQHAKQLNDLFYILGRDRFVHRFTSNSSPNFTDTEAILLAIEQEKIEKYIKGKSKDIYVQNVHNYKAGIVFAEQYISELGNALAELNPELDFIAIVNMSRVISYRTIKEEVNLGDVAAIFGGGGHAKAAGSPVPKEIRQAVTNLLFAVPIA